MIRGEEEFYKSSILWGSYVRQGNLENYNIFSTFNSLSTQVYSTKNRNIVEIYFYVNGKGVELRYYKGEIQVMHDKEEFSNLDAALQKNGLNY